MAITRRQKEVLDFIASFQVEFGYSPSYEEIARGLNLNSIATVHKHISALQTKNYLHRSHNQSRSVEVAPRFLQEQRRNKFEASLEVILTGGTRVARMTACPDGGPIQRHAARRVRPWDAKLTESDNFQ